MNNTITLIDTTTKCAIKTMKCKSQYELRSTIGIWVDYHKSDLEAGKLAINCAIGATP